MKNFAVLITCLFLTACQPEGPAEKQGKQIDQSVQNVKDMVTQPGPAEKAGRKIDSTINH